MGRVAARVPRRPGPRRRRHRRERGCGRRRPAGGRPGRRRDRRGRPRAAQRGARVIATATPGAGAELVRSLGADATVDHTADLGSAVRELAPDGVTKVAHAAGEAKQLGGLLAAHGRLVSLQGADQLAVGRDDVAVTAVLALSSGPKLASLLGAVAAGTLTVPEPRRYPMERADALDAFATGKVGKIVVTVP